MSVCQDLWWVLSYNGFLGLAATASNYERSMNTNLMQMIKKTAEASSLQAKAADDGTMAASNQERAAADQAESDALHLEGDGLRAESEADAAAAKVDGVTAEEFQAKAAEEEASSMAHSEAASVAATAEETAWEEAGVDGTAAARLEAAVAEDEFSVGLCQLVPFLDVACDVVGGATAVVWETMAADEAAKSAVESAAAIAAGAEEEREAAAAAASQELSIADFGKASELEGEAASLQAKAEEEAAEAEELEAEALSLQEKSEAEEALAEEETTEAMAEEEEASKLLEESLLHGVQACWDGFLVTVVGLIALTFFGLQLSFSIFIPGVLLVSSSFANATTAGGGFGFTVTRGALQRVGWLLFHVEVFVLTTLYYQNSLASFGHLEIRTRGEIILHFGIMSAMITAIGWHMISQICTLPSTNVFYVAAFDVALHTFLHFILYFPLFVLEFLILWIVCSSDIFSSDLLSHFKLLRVSLATVLTAGMVHWLTRAHTAPPAANSQIKSSSASSGVEGLDPEAPPLTETTALLGQQVSERSQQQQQQQQQRRCVRTVATEHTTTFLQSIRWLRYPLEIFVCCSMVALLLHCIPNLQLIWPASRALLRQHIPRWLAPAVIVLVVFLFFVGFNAATWRSRTAKT